MALETDNNVISHIADGATFTFPYDFRIDSEDHLFVYFGDDLVDPGLYDGSVGIGNDDGGEVTFLTEPPADTRVIIARIVEFTQEMVYPDYGPFPAKSHETALDKNVMMSQQLAERILASLRMPVGDQAETALPGVEERALSYLFFDIDGNAVTIPYEPPINAVVQLIVKDDSVNLLHVDSSNNRFPEIGFTNVNGPNGPVQLNNQGKVPFDNIGFTGVQLLGPFRGDDLCDKPGDEVGDCTAPDYRNPSERFPDLVPSFPGEPGKFVTGDTFLLSFEEPEVNGNMNLFTERGGTEDLITVEPRDAIVFISGWDPEGNPLPNTQQGWYHIPKLAAVGTAVSIVYDPAGRAYITPTDNNVQLAINALDNEFVTRDSHYLTEKDGGLSARDGGPNANNINRTGFYTLASGADNSPDPTSDISISIPRALLVKHHRWQWP